MLDRQLPVLWQVSRPSSDADAKPKDLALYEKVTTSTRRFREARVDLARMRSRHSADELAICRTIRISEAGFVAAAPRSGG